MTRPGLKKLRDVVRRQPGDAQLWYELGAAALEAGDLEEARYALVHSVYLAPDEVERALAAGQLLVDAGCTEDAEHVVRRVVQRVPDRADARVALARLLCATGDAAGALEQLAPVLHGESRTLGALLVAASAHELRGGLSEAADLLAQALTLDLDHLETNRRLAVLLGQLGDVRGAIRAWRRVIKHTAHSDVEALTLLGISLSTDGQHGEATKILTEVAARPGADSGAQANLGMALMAATHLDQALTALQRALALDPRSAQAYCGIGLVHQQQGRRGEAVDAFEMTERLAPDSPIGPMNLGLALQALGDEDGARAALERAAALAPGDEEIERALAQLGGVPELAHDEPTRPAARVADQPATPEPVLDEHTIKTSTVATREVESFPRGEAIRPPLRFEAAIAGQLDSFDLSDVLQLLQLQGKTGALVVSSERGAGMVRLAGGRLTSASAPGVKRLGEALIERRFITTADLEDVLAQQISSTDDQPEALGTLLLRRQLIDEQHLAEVLQRQTMTALEEILRWTDGAFSFHREADQAEPIIAFDMQGMLLEIMRRRDEGARARSPRPVR